MERINLHSIRQCSIRSNQVSLGISLLLLDHIANHTLLSAPYGTFFDYIDYEPCERTRIGMIVLRLDHRHRHRLGCRRRSTARQIVSKLTEFFCPSSTSPRSAGSERRSTARLTAKSTRRFGGKKSMDPDRP